MIVFDNIPTQFIAGTPAKLAYEERPGARPTLLCVHGNSSHRGLWRLLLAELAEFHAIAYDTRGHGDSDWIEPPRYNTPDYAADIARVVTALNLRDYVLLAHSAGGLAALFYVAAAAQPPRALVFFDAEACVPRWQVDYFRERAAAQGRTYASPEQVARGFQKIYPSTPFDHLLQFVASGMRQVEGGWQQKLDPATFATWEPGDLRPILHNIACPTLVVRGGDSSVLSSTGLEELVAGLPRGRGLTIPGTSHLLLLEAAVEIAWTIRGFLAEIVENK
jgi:pimeloyl-ACP methyl ester carboxylesterase